jgi:hypothetical protein
MSQLPVVIITTENESGRKRLSRSFPSWALQFDNATTVAGVVGKDLSPSDPRIGASARLRIEYAKRSMPSDRLICGIQDTLQNLNQVACALSHVRVWEQVVNSGEATVVVEDDVILKGTASHIHDVLRNNPGAVFVSLLNSCGTARRSILECAHEFYGFQVYYITPAGAETLLSGAYPVHMHVDRFLAATVLMKNDTRFRVAQPMIPAREMQFQSSLQHPSVAISFSALVVVAALATICIVALLSAKSCQVRLSASEVHVPMVAKK